MGVCCVVLAAVFLWQSVPADTAVFAPQEETAPVTVVVDPGHGGVDGGAVSSGGVEESQINLELGLRVNDLLRFCGLNTMMTRQDDRSIHSEGADTIRAKKASDLRNRVAMVNAAEHAVLLSIHQNSLPSSPQTHGAQAFWNGQEGAQALAEAVQAALNTAVNPERPKEAKAMGSSVYLMKNAQAPGVLVECGFLSNEEETARLQDGSYQRRLAAAMTAGLLAGLYGEEPS